MDSSSQKRGRQEHAAQAAQGFWATIQSKIKKMEAHMHLKRVWLVALAALVALALLVAACGPDMSTSTPGGQATAPTQAATPVATQGVQATDTPAASGELPVDPNDWRTLGSAEAKVTLIEYSDFQ